jgi:GT2 family glycosyltransferase
MGSQLSSFEQEDPLGGAAVGVVAIGRNEGERLRLCLESVVQDTTVRGVVYVDSDSTDGSVALAQSLGVEVVHLDLTQKFTAARARNAGYRRLLQLHPDLRYVQFVDGDCEVMAGWLQRALAEITQDSALAVVCGRRKERHPEYSVYNKLCDLEWDTPVGEAVACGGDALMKVEALERVNGYREDLIAGEEPEMCYRMRQLGYRIVRLDLEMTLHDANISKPSQWYQRTKRAGHAFAESAALHGREPERMGVKKTVSTLFWGAGVPTAVGATALAAGPVVAALTGAAAYGYLFKKSYDQARRRRGHEDALLQAASWVAAKVPEAHGALKYAVTRALGRPTRLMEYK